MKTKSDITLHSLYSEYKKTTDNPVTIKQYKKFYEFLGEKLFQYLVEGNIINLPSHWGQLYLAKRKPKVVDIDGELKLSGYPPDWKLCWEKWYQKYPGRTRQEIAAIKDKPLYYHRNQETDGYRLVLFINKKLCKIKARSIFNFYFVRDKNRLLNKLIKNGITKNNEYNEF